MSYVPIVTPTPSPPSPRSRELADLLRRVIEAYEEGHSTTTRAEIRAATRLALSKAGPSRLGAPIVALTLGGLMALLLGVFVFLRQSGGLVDLPSSVPIIGVGIVTIALAAVAVIRAR